MTGQRVPASETKVSAILATYNGERFVRATVESLLAQAHRPLEIVVCDDGSSDGTLEILRSFGASLTLVRQANRGVSAARNRAASIATGDLLAFVDHDDLWEPDRLAVQVRQLAERPELGLVYSDSWIVDATGEITGRRREHLSYAAGRVFDALLEGNFIPIESVTMPARVFRELGGFAEDARYCEDWELCLRAARRHPIGFWPEPLARYRIHGGNLSYDMVAILSEYAAILADLPRRIPDLTAAEREHVETVLRRRCGELAWYAIKRRDFAAAEAWLERARPVRPRSLAAKVAVFGAVLKALPPPMASRIGRSLERRGLFGSVRT